MAKAQPQTSQAGNNKRPPSFAHELRMTFLFTTPQKQKSPEHGFTIIEVLCVLVMIGLLSGVVVMNLPPQKSATLKQAENLTRNLNALSQDALISGEIRAFGLSESDYGFYNYDGVAFTPVTTKAWDDNAQINFFRNGEKVKLPETNLPVIIFEPTRRSTVFRLELSDQKGTYRLISTGNGRVAMDSEE